MVRSRKEVEDEKSVFAYLLRRRPQQLALNTGVLIASVAGVLRDQNVHFQREADVSGKLIQHSQILPVRME